MSSATASSKIHKRAYQACIPCRERRVRCDLGSVDNPREGPCGRCRRERKFCHFSATRGKKKSTSNASVELANDNPNNNNHNTNTNTNNTNNHNGHAFNGRPTPSIDGSLAGIGVGASHTRRSNSEGFVVPTGIKREFSRVASPTRSTTGGTGGTGGSGGAAGDTGGATTAEKLLQNAAYTSHDALNLLWEAGRHSERVAGMDIDVSRAAQLASSARRGNQFPAPPPSVNDYDADSNPLEPWSNLRFVRTGLFTAEEALDLVNYFHTYLAPFTPISSSSFQDPSMHSTLLEEEPILAVTILMLASRYKQLSGPGSVSRSYMVHERLWQHLQGMISRMIFGQEQFTGGTTPDHGTATDTILHHYSHAEYALAGSSFGSLRTLGTCEALLLLSEWHPRSLHVPAGDDGDSIIVKDDVRRTMASTAGIGGRIRIDWLEPVWRSDRMCWSMLGNALALAVELGIFDEYDNTTIGARESRRDIWNNPLSSQRAYLVQHLLWVYLTQTSGRLGWKNLTSVSVTDHEASTKHGDTIRCWVGVATLMKRGNELLFPSRERTRDIVNSGEYLALLRALNPLLRDWQREFDRAKLSKQMRSILTIEYGYVRAYTNSLALQAVVERCYRNTADGGAIPVSTMVSSYEENQEYFTEVITAAKSILQTVVEELVPDDRLKHVPIRTYSRILAGAMFGLKAIALGAKDNEISVSLSLVERTAEALCTCVVDDVHLSNRFGELVQALAASLRNRVVQMSGSEIPSGCITPSQVATQRQQFHSHSHSHSLDTGPPEIGNVASAPGSYEIPNIQSARESENQSVADAVFDTYPPGSTSAPAVSGSSGYVPLNAGPALMDQAALQQDPLISFAGLGPNQLGWSGGQDFFDMLGPLLDVQYEQYR